jgi:hypothetical protein
MLEWRFFSASFPPLVPTMKFYLIVAKGPKQGMPIPITIDLFLIGSDPMCQLRKEGLGVKHCALITRDKKVFVRDFDSGQSTLVNGSVIPPGQEWPLHSGDRIEMGPLDFRVRVREHSLSQNDLEEWAASCLEDNHERSNRRNVEDDVLQQQSTAAQAATAIIAHLLRQKGNVVGRLRIGLERGHTVVRINDSAMVDESEIAQIKKELCDKLSKPNLLILLDLKNVRRLSSAGCARGAASWRYAASAPRSPACSACSAASTFPSSATSAWR